jgi:hypothetical protein
MAKKSELIAPSNPFLFPLVLNPVTKFTEWTVTKGGEVSSGTIIPVPRQIDYSEGSWYSKDVVSELHTFSKPALQVLGYIMSHLRWNQDFIEIKRADSFNPEFPRKLVMTKTQFYTGIRELTSRAIIADRPSRVSTYWLNPSVIFHGNRLKAFPQCIKQEATSSPGNP